MMNKTDLLFQMMEQPQAYTEQQWQDILSDEECRELYTLMSKTQSAFDAQKEIGDETIDAEWKRLTVSTSRKWLRVAAMFVGILLISGIAYAAYYAFCRTMENVPQSTDSSMFNAQCSASNETDSLVRFVDVRLDSILTVVGSHYAREVCFRNVAPRELRFTITWNSQQPMAVFVGTLNEFDGLQLTEERDTLFVESAETTEE